MTARSNARMVRPVLPLDIIDGLDAQAEAADIDLGVLAAAVLVGALRLGQVDRLLAAGLDRIPHKRRARRPLPWVRDDAGGNPAVLGAGPQEAGTWRYPHPLGDWTMVRLGDHTTARSPGPDDGWWLEGPGLGDALNVGLRRDDATQAADGIIRAWLRKQENGAEVTP